MLEYVGEIVVFVVGVVGVDDEVVDVVCIGCGGQVEFVCGVVVEYVVCQYVVFDQCVVVGGYVFGIECVGGLFVDQLWLFDDVYLCWYYWLVYVVEQEVGVVVQCVVVYCVYQMFD